MLNIIVSMVISLAICITAIPKILYWLENAGLCIVSCKKSAKASDKTHLYAVRCGKFGMYSYYHIKQNDWYIRPESCWTTYKEALHAFNEIKTRKLTKVKQEIT